MTNNTDTIKALLEKLMNNQADSADYQLLELLVNEGAHDAIIPSLLEEMGEKVLPSKNYDFQAKEALLNQILDAMDTKESVQPSTIYRIPFLRRWGVAAASIILIISVAIAIVVFSHRQPLSRTLPASQLAAIAPGKQGAVLTLADGTQVLLDSLGYRVIANQNGAEVVLKNGGLAYGPIGKTTGAIEYNTITTPKGRQFQVTLPDGTQVWLNAGSSIHYPTLFAGKERRVEVMGEVYFEVVKNAKMPFRVNANKKAEVEVLGTHFNVNAYENESAIRTTLLEGAVAVAVFDEQQPKRLKPVLLKPGQQAQIEQVRQQLPQEIKIVDHANIEKLMAWKNGLFNFEGASLEEVMKQIERWYDIEVVYKKGIPNIRFEGEMTKGLSLSDLLMALKRSDVKFQMEGRKLIVLP